MGLDERGGDIFMDRGLKGRVALVSGGFGDGRATSVWRWQRKVRG